MEVRKNKERHGRRHVPGREAMDEDAGALGEGGHGVHGKIRRKREA